MAGAFCSARLDSALLPLPPFLPPHARRRHRRAPLPPLGWLRSAAGGGGRSRAHASAGISTPPLGPPRPQPPEERPALAVCPSACGSAVPPNPGRRTKAALGRAAPPKAPGPRRGPSLPS